MTESKNSLENNYEYEEINLFRIAKIVLKHKKIILAFSAATTLISLGLNLLRPNLYTSTATLMPIEKAQSPNLASMLGTMGGGFSMLASQVGIGDNGATEKFVTVLQTRTMAETIISKNKLMPILFKDRWNHENHSWKVPVIKIIPRQSPPSMQDAVRALAKSTTIKSDKKSGVVSVSVTTWEPQIAAQVANAYVDELDTYLKTNALSTAKRNRLFVEGQLNKA